MEILNARDIPADSIISFRGRYGFLSNMYDCPIVYKCLDFSNAESAYQFAKGSYVGKIEMLGRWMQFRNLTGPESKKAGRRLPLREDWDNVKVDVMREILFSKFELNSDLADKLINTGTVTLVEVNTWRDNFWGVCSGGSGYNMLGKILMEIRSKLTEEK